MRQRVHQAGACLRQTRQSVVPVSSLSEEALLHPLLLPLHLLQEALLLLLQGLAGGGDLREHLLPRPASRRLGEDTAEGVGGRFQYQLLFLLIALKFLLVWVNFSKCIVKVFTQQGLFAMYLICIICNAFILASQLEPAR